MDIWYITAAIVFLVVGTELYTLFTHVPTVTSSHSMRKKMRDLIACEKEEGRLRDPMIIYDLGSGSGKLVLELARSFPKAQVIGLELSPIPFLLSLLRQALWRVLFNVRNAHFKRRDYWKESVADASVVVLYINGYICEKMAQKLDQELKDQTLVISNETHLPNWKPEIIYEVGFLNLKLPLYRIGSHKENQE